MKEMFFGVFENRLERVNVFVYFLRMMCKCKCFWYLKRLGILVTSARMIYFVRRSVNIEVVLSLRKMV
jgi:hypothetical protein